MIQALLFSPLYRWGNKDTKKFYNFSKKVLSGSLAPESTLLTTIIKLQQITITEIKISKKKKKKGTNMKSILRIIHFFCGLVWKPSINGIA